MLTSARDGERHRLVGNILKGSGIHDTTSSLLNPSVRHNDKFTEGHRPLGDPAHQQFGMHDGLHEPADVNTNKHISSLGPTTEGSGQSGSLKDDVDLLQSRASPSISDGKSDRYSSAYQCDRSTFSRSRPPSNTAPDDDCIQQGYPKPDFNMGFSLDDLKAPETFAGPNIVGVKAIPRPSTEQATSATKVPGYRRQLRRAATVFRRSRASNLPSPSPNPNPNSDPLRVATGAVPDLATKPDAVLESSDSKRRRLGGGSRTLTFLTRGRDAVVSHVLGRPDRKSVARKPEAPQSGVSMAAAPGVTSGKDLVVTKGKAQCELAHPVPRRVAGMGRCVEVWEDREEKAQCELAHPVPRRVAGMGKFVEMWEDNTSYPYPKKL